MAWPLRPIVGTCRPAIDDSRYLPRLGKLGTYNQCFFLTKGPAFHVTANFYIIGFLTGWSYFSMSFDWLAAKVDYDWLSFGMWRVQKATLPTTACGRAPCIYYLVHDHQQAAFSTLLGSLNMYSDPN